MERREPVGDFPQKMNGSHRSPKLAPVLIVAAVPIQRAGYEEERR